MTSADLQAAVEWFRAQRLAQGLPATVEDPLALAKLAAILREHTADEAALAAAAVEQSA